jgi:hypothetical protein
MKRKFSLSATALAFVLTTLAAGNAHAATGCFPDTNGHWAETFVCWMKDSGITAGYGDGTFRPENSITRAETSVFLKKLSDLQDSKNSGLILVNAGFGDWKPFTSSANLSYTYFSSYTDVTKATVGSDFLSIHPSIPTVLYGKSLQLVGVEFCYTANAGTSLTYVEINKTTATSNAGGRTLLFSDPTARADAACRYYVLGAPATLTAEDGMNFFIQATWSTATASFDVGRTTFVLQTTGVAAAPPSMPLKEPASSDGATVRGDQPSTTPEH